MQGFNIAEGGHVAQLLPPQNITGASSAAPINPAFSMKNYKHATILVLFGAEGTQDATTLLVYLCSSAAGAGATAIPFNYYFQAAGGAGNDVLSSIQNAPATGVVLSAANAPANGVIAIEIDVNELEAATGGSLGGSLGVDSYVGVGLGAPAAADYAAVVVILSGAREAYVSSPSVTT
jgi:predicted alpha/beta-hydrolase family hydrolase